MSSYAPTPARERQINRIHGKKERLVGISSGSRRTADIVALLALSLKSLGGTRGLSRYF